MITTNSSSINSSLIQVTINANDEVSIKVINTPFALTADVNTAFEQVRELIEDTSDNAIPKSIGTAPGDMIYFSAGGTPARLAKGTNGQVLKVNSSGNLEWEADDNYITVKFWS